jgi:hypothetical protein
MDPKIFQMISLTICGNGLFIINIVCLTLSIIWGIFKIRVCKVSGTESLSVIRWGGGDSKRPSQLGPIERVSLRHWKTMEDLSSVRILIPSNIISDG